MGVFLFLKQFVDMFYQWKILDYGMVVFAGVLLLLNFFLKKQYQDIKSKIKYYDFIIGGLCILYLQSFISEPEFYGVLFKILSVFLIFYLGRSFGEKIFSYGRCLAFASYFVIYLNLIRRFIQFGCKVFVNSEEKGLLNSGGFYYYKSDYAIGIIIAVIFIYFYSSKKYLKWITIFPVAIYMVFYSYARMEMIILLIEYIFILLDCFRKTKTITYEKIEKKLRRVTLISVIGLLILFVIIQILPYEQINVTSYDENGNFNLLERIMHSRHVTWWNIGHYISEQPLWHRMIGFDLGKEYLYSVSGDRAHSMYVKQLYATGYLGCLGILLLFDAINRQIKRAVDRKNALLVKCLCVMLCLAGLTIESIESTQMSWFPFLFAGALLSCKNPEIVDLQKKENITDSPKQYKNDIGTE